MWARDFCDWVCLADDKEGFDFSDVVLGLTIDSAPNEEKQVGRMLNYANDHRAIDGFVRTL